MKVEFFHTVGCKSCEEWREALRTAAERAMPGLAWREVDVTRELDYAVEMGVASLPSVAIDGKVVFTSLPTADQLRKAVLARRLEISGGR